MPHRFKVWWSALGMVLSLVLPFIGNAIAILLFPETGFFHLPIHSLLEVSGGLMALAMAGILMAEQSHRPAAIHFVSASAAFLAMGCLDLFHAAVIPGNLFVWLRSLSTLTGGCLLATVWLNRPGLSRLFATEIPCGAFGISLLAAAASCLWSDRLPDIQVNGQFTLIPIVMNLAGGIGFLAAGVFFVKRFHSQGDPEDWLFAMQTMLLGGAGLMFESSGLWDAAWWWWHVLRLGAYIAALGFVVRTYLNAEKQVLQLNRELIASNQKLDETVAQRTQKLRANEERYELAVKGSTDGLWDWNLKTNEVYYAARFKELLGFADHEISNAFSEFETRLHPEDHDQISAAIRRHLETRNLYDVEYRLRTRSGEYRWFRARGQAIWNDLGQATRMAGSITDIHAGKQAEAALEHEQFLLQTLLTNLPDAIYFKDAEGKFLRVSAALAERLAARDPAAVVGQTDSTFFPVDYARQAHAEEQLLMKTGSSLIGKEERPKWPDGTQSTVLTTKIPLRDRNGEIVGTCGISHDVTAIKHAEERFRKVVDATPNPILVVDRQGRIQMVNQACSVVFGYQPEELLVPERSREAHVLLRTAYWEKPEARSMRLGRELAGCRKDGSEFAAELGLSPIVIDREPLVLVSVFDVTIRHEAEAALREGKVAAEQANQAKSDFLANMSHEIRTPMNAIIGMSELLLNSVLTVNQKEYLMIVLESAEGLLSIINEILDFSKVEAGKLELDEVDFDLRAEIGDAMKSLALRAHSKELELAWHVHPQIPTYLRGDPNRLRQVLVNLVGNAIKFTTRGEVFVDVAPGETAANSSEIGLHFSVSDTGMGIPLDKQEKIFKPFEQADTSTTRQFGGTGLGLAITSRIVSAMHGRIWVESEIGRGSTFRFDARFALGTAPQNSDDVAPLDLTGVSVLVVDDNPLNRRIFKEMLESWGMQVMLAEGGRQALELLHLEISEKGSLPLVISDVNMPEMDGFEFVRLLRSIRRLQNAVVILLTSSGRPGESQRCEELGIQLHMMKPVKQSEMLDAILSAIGRPHRDLSAFAAAAAGAPKTIPPLRFLLAEDGKANQRLARALLEMDGHKVTVAENGRIAVDLFREERFDVILMDVQMPEMDGFAATQEIRKLEQGSAKHIPIIAMTARAMKGDREKCLAAGMDDYVAKPFRKQELYAAIALQADGKCVAADGTQVGGKQNPPTHAAGEKLIDWKVALHSVQGDEGLLRELIGDSLSELPELLAGLDSATAAGNAIEARRCAHTTKSTGRIFGIPKLIEAAMRVEKAAEQKDFATVIDHTPALRNVVESAMGELRQKTEPPQ